MDFSYRISLLPRYSRRGHTNRSSAIRRLGSVVSVWRISQPCFFAVERSERITPKSFAPSVERKPPEIFCRSFIIRPSRSAKLFVKGTRGSVRKRSTSCLRVLRRSKRLWPIPVSYTHLRAHETRHDLVCRLLLEKKKSPKHPYT